LDKVSKKKKGGGGRRETEAHFCTGRGEVKARIKKKIGPINPTGFMKRRPRTAKSSATLTERKLRPPRSCSRINEQVSKKQGGLMVYQK